MVLSLWVHYECFHLAMFINLCSDKFKQNSKCVLIGWLIQYWPVMFHHKHVNAHLHVLLRLKGQDVPCSMLGSALYLPFA